MIGLGEMPDDGGLRPARGEDYLQHLVPSSRGNYWPYHIAGYCASCKRRSPRNLRQERVTGVNSRLQQCEPPAVDGGSGARVLKAFEKSVAIDVGSESCLSEDPPCCLDN